MLLFWICAVACLCVLQYTNPNPIAKKQKTGDAVDDSEEAAEDDDDNEDDDDDDYFGSRTLYLPEAPETFVPPSAPTDTQMVTLNGKTLQVIVKFANIELTPDSPSFSESNWHVEGMKNEHIVASGIYYFATENITESRLMFRQAVCEPVRTGIFFFVAALAVI